MESERPKRREITAEDRALGGRIKARREYLKLSQTQVAIRMGKETDKAVAHWESGYARISGVEMIELARVLRCSVAYLAGEEEAPFLADPQWFGQLGRAMETIPLGKLRDLYKSRLRDFALSEADFLRRLADQEANR